MNLAVNVAFFSSPGEIFDGKAPKRLFCLNLSRFGLSFELSMKVLITSKTNGMTHAESFAMAVTTSDVTKSSRLQLKRACDILLALQRAGCVAANGWQPPRLSICILRLRHAQHGAAAAQPRRANFGLIDHTNVDFVARIRILMLGTSLLLEQASRGGAISLGDAMSHRRCVREDRTRRSPIQS